MDQLKLSSALTIREGGPSQVTVGSSNIDTEQSGPSEAQSCERHRAERTSSAAQVTPRHFGQTIRVGYLLVGGRLDKLENIG